MNRMKMVLLLAAVFTSGLAWACNDPAPGSDETSGDEDTVAEEAGEAVDEAADDTGEAVDEAAEEVDEAI